jgi:hypothetical protein
MERILLTGFTSEVMIMKKLLTLSPLLIVAACSQNGSTIGGRVAATHRDGLIAVATTSRGARQFTQVNANGTFALRVPVDSRWRLRFVDTSTGTQTVVGTAVRRSTGQPLMIHSGQHDVDVGDVGDEDQDLDPQHGSTCTGSGQALPVQNEDDGNQDGDHQGLDGGNDDDQGENEDCSGGNEDDDHDNNAQGNDDEDDVHDGGVTCSVSACVPNPNHPPGTGGAGGGAGGTAGASGTAGSGGAGGHGGSGADGGSIN